jgi:hemin uptake protein HemP
VKLNGLPYYCPIYDLTGWWEIVASNSENPTRLLLEMIWTKISAEMGVTLPMDDTLEKEQFFPFLRQQQIQQEIDGVLRKGFYMELIDKAPPSSTANKQNWSPQDTNTVETVTLLQATNKGFINSDDASFARFAAEEQTTPADVLGAMVKKRVLGWMDASHSKARPIESTVMTVFTPSGDVVVSDQTEMLNLWTLNNIGKTTH